jgi:uncharacterized protein YeaC (DUF1315 family)
MTPASVQATADRIARILEVGRWPTGRELTARERVLLERTLESCRERLEHRGAWARQ